MAAPAVLVLLGACWYIFVYPSSDSRLRSETLHLSQELESFAKLREGGRPNRQNQWLFRAESDRLFDAESDRLYAEQFEARVLKVRRAFEKRGFSRQDLGELYLEHGEMYHTYAAPEYLHREAQKLSILADQLK